ncbi:MAG: hypothetical protein B7X41_12410 [Microbacterium sp. 14-71-5]|uniref:DUF1048 domain-containing protein n=1 Tax=Microbacterium sp. 13-71-7 TaxID=1970399 RepID=UPI000BC9035F|nr:DUF1048 domain-containing protein [Microbacterium sp. 13-71-7]OZB83251.1 MAG: hypothetical protein B7X32_10935 [Microbacterium sp. 13-71-7]OZB87625.1 MAG: hypothetical protein B7X41_12410 [Microbacterium sp. 14-71-5]
MNFWEKVTGGDLNRVWRDFQARAEALPAEHRAAWDEIMKNLMLHGDFSGRNLTPICDGVLGLLEASAAQGQSVEEVLGDDIPGFCAAVGGDQGAKDFRARWRDQLNHGVARRLNRVEG